MSSTLEREGRFRFWARSYCEAGFTGEQFDMPLSRLPDEAFTELQGLVHQFGCPLTVNRMKATGACEPFVVNICAGQPAGRWSEVRLISSLRLTETLEPLDRMYAILTQFAKPADFGLKG